MSGAHSPHTQVGRSLPAPIAPQPLRLYSTTFLGTGYSSSNYICRLSTLMSTPRYVDFHIKLISANTVLARDSRKQLTRQCYRQDVYDLPLG